MKPIKRGIIVKAIDEEKTTSSGLILKSAVEKKNLCKVISVGDKVEFVKVGDIVKRYDQAGVTLDYQDEQFILLQEDRDVISIMTDDINEILLTIEERNFVFPDDMAK